MKVNVISVVALFFSVLVLASCGSKSQEERIKELEAKLADMEETSSATPAPTTTPVNQPAAEVKPEGPIPTFEFAETAYDFGEIVEGEVVEHTFKFTNTGEAPLLIESARGSCGCTVPTWPKEPIPVNGTGEIVVRFDSKGKPGVQAKTVTITANTFPSVSKLNIRSTVSKASDAAGPVAQ